jgi:hypothetical protein
LMWRQSLRKTDQLEYLKNVTRNSEVILTGFFNNN